MEYRVYELAIAALGVIAAYLQIVLSKEKIYIRNIFDRKTLQ